MERPRTNCYSASSSFWSRRRSRSISGVQEDLLNESPRLSYHNPAINVERRVHYGKSYSYQELASRRSSTESFASSETPKPVEELVREISTLEHEIIHKERHLLSLYRAAFDQYLPSSPALKSPLANYTGSPRIAGLRKAPEEHNEPDPGEPVDWTCQSKGFKSTRESPFNLTCIEWSPADPLAGNAETENELSEGFDMTDDPSKNSVKCISGHHSLADHLGASIMDHVPEICSKLSEDIVRCISAIYCKLASPLSQSSDQFTSPTPSVSSSSTFSPQDPANDTWSPKGHYESDKDNNSQHSIMIEVQQLCINGERFGYASKMLKIFRSLIRRLETIDPRKMAYEEQLTFWINIHNSLMMHALLAYGLRESHMRSSFSSLKAAYDIGGHSINAYLIQSSILRCQPHLPSVWFGKLILPAFKFMMGNGKHPYVLDHPEPLVHFALCSGASSDPVLRVYTAKSIYQDLELAKAEFIQSNVSVLNKTTVILPKLLQYYAKDASLELRDVLEIVCDHISEAQQKVIQGCYKRRCEKCVTWSTCKLSLRYLVHTDLAKHFSPNSSYS